MTDAVISTLDYGSDFSYMVNSVLDSSDASDCSNGIQPCSEIGEGIFHHQVVFVKIIRVLVVTAAVQDCEGE